ncbi:hypothetical protein DdX_08299 [Ditylenchus destructor]|uniref:Uncharacterized protein n=1 Tax=Ditylenchus destructor TaxID=166010 RepID=A0AAD4N1Y8_9BILA|nr:hypothetical protein DdX_08299 [Ditylenchus destructor]
MDGEALTIVCGANRLYKTALAKQRLCNSPLSLANRGSFHRPKFQEVTSVSKLLSGVHSGVCSNDGIDQ